MSSRHNTMVMKAWTTGMRRVNKILEQEASQGYKAFTTGMYSESVDIIVVDPDLDFPLAGSYDSIIRVYEVTNYASPEMYIQQERAERYKDNLLQFQGHKIFVCSFEENLRYVGGREFFEKEGIEVQIVGYQD